MDKKEKIERLYHQMLTEVQDYSIVLLDSDGTILTWNKGAEEIKGYKSEEIIGQNFEVFYTLTDRQYKLPEKLIALAMKEGRAKHIGRRQRKDGTIFWGSILLTAIRDENNDVVGFIKLTRELLDNEIS
jgi:PAS domain S-box-containing protein